MGSIADEIKSYQGCHEYDKTVDILHYGMPRRSGRYPWGSGENSYQHSRDFLGRVEELKKSNFTYTDADGKKYTGDNAIAKSMGLTTSEYRRQISWAGYERRLQQVETAKSLKEDGLGNTEIGRKMGLSESTVRSLLNPTSEGRMNKAMETVDFLWEQLNEKKMIDVGTDVEKELGISRERLDLAIDYLEKSEGCPVYKGGIPQVTNPGQQTNQRVLCLPGTEHKEIYNYENVKTITEYASHDGGETFSKFQYPESLSSSRLMIRYKDDVDNYGATGNDKDGLIELRRGVDDISLGDAKYSQVRILVDGTHYLKGMAIYSDDLPDGVDVVFNTNKSKDTPALGPKDNTVLKNIKKDDPDNPFGSAIKPNGQSEWTDADGNKHLRVINKRSDEGDWSDWKDTLPSQFLGKQSKTLAKQQLNLAKADKLNEFDEICKLDNPTIKKHLLEKFADTCDLAAVDLKAAALPGQKYHVIIPINSMKDTEVYAPKYENGTQLALIRYPHGGLFEIPILTVNNRNKLAKQTLDPDIEDAVGINKKIADQLSGADYDGDAVMAIPISSKVRINNQKPLKELKDFDAKLEYGYDDFSKDSDGVTHYYRNGQEFRPMKATGLEMGKISNLITDMTLGGATNSELARAVKHSMVVIDAEKHKLDYKASEIENDISALKKKYQIKLDNDGNVIGYGGASTILSSSKGEYSADKRQGSYKINKKGTEDYDPTRPEGAKIWKTADNLYYPDRSYDKKTGLTTIKTEDGKKIVYDRKDAKSRDLYDPVEMVDETTGRVTYTNKDGTITYRTMKSTLKSTNMAETDNAYSLVSAYRHPMEIIYADYANDMKSLANRARLELTETGKVAYNSTAKKQYETEVKELMTKLDIALMNSPKERTAQRLANAEVKAKTKKYEEEHDGESMKPADKKKLSQQALSKYRSEVGSVARRNRNIDINDKEWEAIQAGAVSENKLKKILNNTDIDKLRERATPRTTNTVSSANINLMKRMAASDYTLDEIAARLGVSTSTVSKYLKGGK